MTYRECRQSESNGLDDYTLYHFKSRLDVVAHIRQVFTAHFLMSLRSFRSHLSVTRDLQMADKMLLMVYKLL